MTLRISTAALATGPEAFVIVPSSDPLAICEADGCDPISNRDNAKMRNFAQSSMSASACVGSKRPAKSASPDGGDRLRARAAEGHQRRPFGAIRIVGDLAFVVKNHGRARVGIERGPVRQSLMIRIAAAGEGRPRAAHLFLKRSGLGQLRSSTS